LQDFALWEFFPCGITDQPQVPAALDFFQPRFRSATQIRKEEVAGFLQTLPKAAKYAK